MFNKYISLVVLALCTISCSEPIEVDNSDFEQVLVVEGLMSTRRGSQSIRITQSAKYGDIFEGTVKGVTNASVAVRDEQGNNIRLVHSQNGFYHTPESFKPQVGEKYILTINVDDQTYNSLPQEVIKAASADSIYSVYKEYPTSNEKGIVTYVGGTDIYAKFSRNSTAAAHYLWKYSGTFFIRTYPELYEGGMPPRPMPKSCCADCWKSERGNQIILSSLESGNTSTDARLFFLEDNGYRFYEKYALVLERYSLSDEAYSFYKLMQSQLSINGDIFDPPPATIRGNILNINNLDELVIGYFAITDVQRDTLIIEGSSIPKRRGLPVFPDDCQVLPNTTVSQPSYW